VWAGVESLRRCSRAGPTGASRYGKGPAKGRWAFVPDSAPDSKVMSAGHSTRL
jgi:hypothetical protein